MAHNKDFEKKNKHAHAPGSVPDSVATSLKGATHTAVGERGRVGLRLQELGTRKGINGNGLKNKYTCFKHKEHIMLPRNYNHF
jgi:hypothetical protein